MSAWLVVIGIIAVGIVAALIVFRRPIQDRLGRNADGDSTVPLTFGSSRHDRDGSDSSGADSGGGGGGGGD
jgi:hypothetical protein